MPLTIELPPELELRLEAEAGQRHMTPTEYALSLIKEALVPSETPSPDWQRTNPQGWLQAFDRWMDSHDPRLPPLSDEATNRASFYGERG